jgi:KipI family sensor histidine kinase inhibitor
MSCRTREVVDGALLVEFPGCTDEKANAAAAAIGRRLAAHPLPGLHDAVPGACTLLVLFDPEVADRAALQQRLEEEVVESAIATAREVRIPVRYGGAHGPDLEKLARGLGKSHREFARLHQSAVYRVAFIGFAPGFPYLTGLPEPLRSPRLSSPRPRVPSGSVGIGGEYTGVYPSSTPGGWNLIGNAPIRLFDSNATPPSLLSPGDRVVFEEIGEEDFAELRARLDRERTALSSPGGPSVLRILSAGLCTSVQGAPLHGLAASGVPSGGAMDLPALRRGNRLLKNRPDAAALEITLQGPQLEFLKSARICIGGSDVDAVLNGRPVSIEQVIDAGPGDRLAIGSVRGGARAYLSISGGFANPAALGEPLHRLGRGDSLYLSELADATPSGTDPVDELGIRPSPSRNQTIRVVLGPQADCFSGAGKATFFSNEYRVSPQSDRRGVRLEGPPIELCASADISPEGTAAGAIQVPSNGMPIILGPDRPVTGGYAKIATVIGADQSLLAQASPGTLIRFQPVSIAEALAARRFKTR